MRRNECNNVKGVDLTSIIKVTKYILVDLGWIIGPFRLDTFGELIYGTEGETLVYGVFTVDEINKIYVPGATAMFYFVGFALLIGIIMAGMKVSSTGINPSNRTYVIEFFKDLLIVGIILFNLEHIYQILFSINNAIVVCLLPKMRIS